MIWLFVVLFFLHGAEPDDSIMLTGTFGRAECYEGSLYLAPGIGTSIFRFYTPDSMNAVSLTDDVNYRIRGFKLTPFAIYINRGTALDKYYPASGKIENVYSARDISSFDLTQLDEIILADRQNRELVFLDFEFKAKFRISNITVEDLQWHNNLLYVLAKSGVYIYDEHGNQIEKKPIPERCNRLVVADHELLIFTQNTNYVLVSDSTWQKKDFSFTILDICVQKNSYVMLDGTGSILHILDHDSL
jgi:hypothetical protein